MKRISIKMIILVIVVGIFNSIRIIPTIYRYEVLPCTIDGVIVFSMSGVSLMLVPLIIVFFNINAFKYDFKGYNIVRRRQKMDVWHRQMIYIYFQCVLVTAVLMACAGAVFYDSTGTISYFEGEWSIFAIEFEKAGLTPPDSVNVVPMVVLSLILNSGEMYARVLAAVIVYWITESSLLTILSSVVFGTFIPRRGIVYKNKIDVDWWPFYTELYDAARLLQSIAVIAACIFVIWLLAKYFIPRKEFMKE